MTFYMVLMPLALSVTVCLFLITAAKIETSAQSEQHWIHDYSASRVGGFAIVTSFLICLYFFSDVFDGLSFEHVYDLDFRLKLIFPCILLFVLGLVEDTAFRISAKIRLVASLSIVAPTIFSPQSSLEVLLDKIDAPDIFMICSQVIAVIFCLSLIHGKNMVDGLNGLASGSSLISLAVFIFLLGPEYDVLLIILASATLGFVCLNFPNGRIFLGDGGAYFFGGFFGFVLLSATNEETLKIIPALMASISYPLIEVAWTAVRRLFITKANILKPDGMHLHSLLYRYLKSAYFKNFSKMSVNSLSALIILCVLALNGFCSIVWPTEPVVRILQFSAMILFYFLAYFFLYSQNKKLIAGATNK